MASLSDTRLSSRRDSDPGARPVALWLLACCAMVFAMAVIGAITRLTESGLSIVEWRPLVGMIPPLSEAEWERVFSLYRQTPEYRLVNHGMDLEAFKGIFFWEWFHRLWGQLIGFAFLVPFLWFAATRRIPRGLWPKLLGLFLLGGLQGGIGWFMVVSGLNDRPSVSHYRLALHLGVAVLIYGLMLWAALGLLAPAAARGGKAGSGRLRLHGLLVLALVALTLVWGAFVAGLDAGLIYPSWPLMGDRLVPAEAWDQVPAWINLFENHATVQFVHRWLAAATAVAALALGVRARAAEIPPAARRLAAAVAAWALVQGGLGVATLLSGVAIPVAALHQAGALVLVTLAVAFLHARAGAGLTR